MLGVLAEPGTRLGRLRPAVAAETGLTTAEVVLPGAHDTASAVLAVPAAGEPAARPDWAYISSGTWSLMGVEAPEPVINDKCRELNFTNEAGVGRTTRLLKNIAGLWLVQECRRIWKLAGQDLDWPELIRRAQASPPLVSLIAPDHADFVAPADMPAAIRDFCQRTDQPEPASEGAVIRCALESLALRYRQVLGWLEELTAARIDTLHIVGGGVQNRLLCQMAADATGRRVVAGPIEATALGNLAVQCLAAGDIASISQAREIIRRSFEVEEYTPGEMGRWDEAFSWFRDLTS
jgi:rhamnulokinase